MKKVTIDDVGGEVIKDTDVYTLQDNPFGNNLTLSFQKGKIMLGTWQAVYLWEHRFNRKERVLSVHIIGEKIPNIYN